MVGLVFLLETPSKIVQVANPKIGYDRQISEAEVRQMAGAKQAPISNATTRLSNWIPSKVPKIWSALQGNVPTHITFVSDLKCPRIIAQRTLSERHQTILYFF
jgi:hypothetical protein